MNKEACADSIQAAHEELLQYTEEAPRMLQQVDNQQFAKLGVKYHHLLIKFERNKALLRKRMEMHASLPNIVLQSPIVQTELKLIEEIQRNRKELGEKKAAVEAKLRQCKNEIAKVEQETAELKKTLFQEKHRYLDVKVDLELLKQSSLSQPPKPIKKIFCASNDKQADVLKNKFSQSESAPSQAQVLSTLMIGLRKLKRQLFQTKQRNVSEALKNTKILRQLKTSVNQNKCPTETSKYELEGTMKKVANMTNCRLGVLADLRNVPVSELPEQEVLKRLKSGTLTWPSEWLLQSEDNPPKKKQLDSSKLTNLNGEQLFRLLCEDRHKLEKFWQILTRKLQTSTMLMTHTF